MCTSQLNRTHLFRHFKRGRANGLIAAETTGISNYLPPLIKCNVRYHHLPPFIISEENTKLKVVSVVYRSNTFCRDTCHASFVNVLLDLDYTYQEKIKKLEVLNFRDKESGILTRIVQTLKYIELVLFC